MANQSKFSVLEAKEVSLRREGLIRHGCGMGKSAAEIEKDVARYNRGLSAFIARRAGIAKAILGR